MAKPQSLHDKDLMIETLIRRQDFFQLIIESHLRWMRITNDERLMTLHRALVDSLKGIAEEYDVLLNELQKPR